MLYISLKMSYRVRSILIVLVCLSTFVLCGNAGCGRLDDDNSYVFKAASAADYSEMGWVEAYDAIHAQMIEQYAFTEWKDLDYATLNSNTRPKIVLAEVNSSEDEYITAFLEYTKSIPDGHVFWSDNVTTNIMLKHSDGSYGFGMVLGDMILEWNDVPIATALALLSTLWSPTTHSLALGGDEHALAAKFKEAMEFLVGRNVPGIIIDVRGNLGGTDALAANIVGYFYSEQTIYEYQSVYNEYTGIFDTVPDDPEDNSVVKRNVPLNIEPQSPQYITKPVVVIVNPDSISSAEGIAMAIKRLDLGHVVSFYGTNGSFGIVGGKASLPLGYSISFPMGRSLDKYKVIQVDSKDGLGCVTPDIRVPKTSANMLTYAKKDATDDVELDAAVAYLQTL